MKKHLKLASLAFLAAAALTAGGSRAAVIAIVDSGTDLNHPDLRAKAWNNPGEVDDAIDNDKNGYVDDLHGWNFPDNNNRLVDKKLIGTFPQDCYKYFDLQTKALMGTATSDEIGWLKAKVKDQSFIEQLEAFGNHVHGSHVAGIASRDSDQAQLMILRLITNGQPSLFIESMNSLATGPAIETVASPSTKEKLVYAMLAALGAAQGKGVAPIGKYIASKKAQVANCSFGSSRAALEPTLKPLIEKILGKTLTDEEMHAYSDFFLNKAADAMKKALIDPSKTTLFVIAAGNDGSNNDVAPTAPANVKAENTITVAATLNHSKLASFSNYGEMMVDIAAPGVGIVSTIPGGQYMPLSGTSQATPYVTNLAARIMDTNPKLSVAEVKTILMSTVDKKDFLVKKVRSEGIANPDRALYAAHLSLSLPLDQAVAQANREVGVVRSAPGEQNVNDADVYVLPLPSFIH